MVMGVRFPLSFTCRAVWFLSEQCISSLCQGREVEHCGFRDFLGLFSTLPPLRYFRRKLRCLRVVCNCSSRASLAVSFHYFRGRNSLPSFIQYFCTAQTLGIVVLGETVGWVVSPGVVCYVSASLQA